MIAMANHSVRVVTEMNTNAFIQERERAYHCDICGKSFTERNRIIVISVVNHSQLETRLHTGEKLYHSDACGKSFCENSNVTLHKYSHTGETPYQCDIY
ncbi:---NA--- [Octopus vulgaris]|uniref:---NA n=1 Tax=Octopus vulgaris TaxID=6645 RepID=A0AA36BXJ4_OCTVU|nr:---NA--- [Octopus vulgaris]